jgi:superfamily I DNA/RNA helicase
LSAPTHSPRAPIPLNPAQAEAVEHVNGPLLVLAGAGSGKTRVITQRIGRLVEKGIPAKAILAMTFTNKAAGEMAERAHAVMHERGNGGSAKALTVSTFHSFGLSVLTREQKAHGGAFTIFDQGDVLSCVKEILSRERIGKNLDAAAICGRISNAKNAFLQPEDLPDDGKDEYDEITKIVYPRYQAAMRAFRAYDFDDLVCEVGLLWKRRPDVLARWQEGFRYLLVDEYQDTNRAQMEVLRLLAAPHKNLCVVGDDDQAIYAWRGADVKNILEFEKHFPGAKVIKLEQNYRSRAPVLDVANAVIAKKVEGHQKTLFTDKLGGDKVQVRVAASPQVEAEFVAREMKKMIRDQGKRPKDFAVLYRSNGQSKDVEEALREQMIAHKVVGGQTFFERKEVKDLLSYLKLTLNRSDEIALRRVINYPPRGIGESSVEKLALHALGRGWTLWQAVERVDALDDIPPAAREGCKALERVMAETRKQLLAERHKASEVARDLCERVGLKRDIEGSSPSNNAAGRRWGNVEALFRTFERRETRRGEAKDEVGGEQGLAAFLHALTLQMNEEEEASDVAILSTLHGAKGLEFDTVFLLGCEEGLLPHSRTLETRATDAAPQDVEEERRLFYVGVTRARERLYLSRAKARVSRGKPAPRTPSRFLLEIPPELVEEEEVREELDPSFAEINEGASAVLAALAALEGLE